MSFIARYSLFFQIVGGTGVAALVLWAVIYTAPGADPAGLNSTATEVARASTPAPARPLATPAPSVSLVGQKLFLTVSGIANESVVETGSLTVTGLTNPEALVSVNGDIVPVEITGSFALDLRLEPGPNFIEFVASDLNGNEMTRVFNLVSLSQ